MKPHIAVYVRVSSSQQDTRSQLPDINSWLTAYAGGSEVVRYVDKFSGTTMNRPAWNKLHAAMTTGLVSKIVVWRLDRLGRTASGLVALFEELQTRKIGFESIKDRVDLGTAAGRLLANVLASVASYETEIRRERVMAGQAAARASGKRWGGSEKGRRITVTDAQVKTIAKMFKDGESKVSMSQATALSRPTIYRILEQLGLQ